MTLNELNFNELIKLKLNNVCKYTFDDYVENNFEHPEIIGYCTDCEGKGIEVCKNKNYCLKNISHGAKTEDFIKAMLSLVDTDGWHNDGVMFIMESPSKDYGIYKDVEIIKNEQAFNKRPSFQWYWIHNKMEAREYPYCFKGRIYGEFVASAILTFKLKNAYMTNLIKCGLNDCNDNYLGINEYNDECIENCIEKFLRKEIDIVKPKVIFTFGTSVFWRVDEVVNKKWKLNIKVVGLPHPARQRAGFKDEYYNVLYFCMIAKWLYKENVIDKSFYREMMMKFADEG